MNNLKTSTEQLTSVTIDFGLMALIRKNTRTNCIIGNRTRMIANIEVQLFCFVKGMNS
ncbi:unnamed protein product [Gongylonema pulchrum]|uniref:Uncharacterized protein n=1 Tax=Gongylonema pulchrum TaxID=637853 RepID=A0A183DC83_9BILA|nr:unnamed protein product [Gongylonema pulchrum]